MQNRWMMNRMGLINFWYYDEEEFQFADGKLLLRGSNGSGKSVTMQSFIPLLLDGNKSPERLDPFGSRARRIENYLLGDEEQGKEERTAYLYMEFKKENVDKYLTIGIGLKGKKGKPVESWGFSIVDGRRVGKDFFLYKNVGEKLPLSKTELSNRIGAGGEVKSSTKEYMAMVNNLLFGFKEIEEYDELIKLLVQLRTPKLSKDFKPTLIHEIMSNALQPLSDDDLRPMTEAIENMDNIQDRLEQLKERRKAAQKIYQVYDQYNRVLLFDKSKAFIQAKEEKKKLQKEKEALEKKKADLKQEFAKEVMALEEMEIQQKTMEQKKTELEKHDSFRIQSELEENKAQLKSMEEQKTNKEKQLEDKKSKEREYTIALKQSEGLAEQIEEQMQVLLEEMNEVAEEFYFEEQAFLSQELQKQTDKAYDFSYITNRVYAYSKGIQEGKKVLEQEKKAAEKHDELLQSLDNAKREQATKEKQLDEVERLLLETKEEFVENIYSWEKKNQELKPSKEVLVEMAQQLQQFGEKTSYSDIQYTLRQAYTPFEEDLRQKKLFLEMQRKEYVQGIDEKEKQIQEWKSKKDPEPVREEKVLRSRQRLIEEGIPFLPLYQAIDFKKEASKETQGVLEEALLDMGLLDALLVPEQYKEKVLSMEGAVADRYLFSSPHMLRHELSHVFQVEKIQGEGITGEQVLDVLQSILLDAEKDSFYIHESGQYGMGILQGKVSKEYAPKYIGVEARKRFREEQIQFLEQEKLSLQQQAFKAAEEIQGYAERIETLKKELQSFPREKDLETALEQVKEARLRAIQSKGEVEKKEQQLEEAHQALQQIRQRVFEETQKLKIPVQLESYEEAEEQCMEYRRLLNDLERAYMQYMKAMDKNKTLQQQLEDIENDLDHLRYDFTKIERTVKELLGRIQSLEEQLQLSNYEEIKQEIEECARTLRELPGKMLATAERKKGAEVEGQHVEEKLQSKQELIDKKEQECVQREKLFIEEYRLGYVFSVEEEAKVYTAQEIYEELEQEEKKEKSTEEILRGLQERLQERYYENRAALLEYYLHIEKLPSLRLDIKARIQGKDVNFISLFTYIEEAIEENQKLLRDSDRQLFEDILANTLSKKIRAKIYHSEQWVKKMNDMMESMNTSSGLSFSLLWKSKNAETEEQMHTRDLVEILKTDVHLLREEDVERFKLHFRSKITEAQKKLEEGGGIQSFHSIMKEVLDYRKWFEFRLYYKKTGENKKELTNNAFHQFSGGEKAMAMYVPLFSSVYARYEGARKDCPRIISLDEAFAGVDEKNIRDMFRLVEELRFNFVMNSQILWGDYDTVSALSICELIRPNNADFVTVLRYFWNGKVKKILIGEEEKDAAVFTE